MSARRRDQNCQFRDEVLTLENDSGGPVTPGSFQSVVEPAIGKHRQSIRGEGRTGRIAQQPFQAHPVATLINTDIGVHTEARDHGAAGTLECIHAVWVDLVPHAHDTMASIAADPNPAADGARQQSGYTGIIL